MAVKEFAEKTLLKCCKEENCGMDECTEPCEQAQWELGKLKFNNKCKNITYPGQEKFGKSNKIFLHIGNEQEIYVSAQAREIIDWQGIDEAKFLASLVALMQGPLNGYSQMRDGWVISARHLSVTKATEGSGDEDEGYPYIQISIREFTGIKNNGKDYETPWRDAYPIISPNQIIESVERDGERK